MALVFDNQRAFYYISWALIYFLTSSACYDHYSSALRGTNVGELPDFVRGMLYPTSLISLPIC